MQDSSKHPLFVATRRLVAALDRLEGNLQHVSVQAERDVKQEQTLMVFERENEALRHEREQLNNAIAQLQDQYGDLHQAASTIYGKLDDSIKRLTQIIEN